MHERDEARVAGRTDRVDLVAFEPHDAHRVERRDAAAGSGDTVPDFADFERLGDGARHGRERDVELRVADRAVRHAAILRRKACKTPRPRLSSGSALRRTATMRRYSPGMAI